MRIKTVGYRYGDAPESGYSWNYRENKAEEGISLASAAGLDEVRSFAVIGYKDKRPKRYYEGIIIGYGGDGEPLMIDAYRISKKEYDKKKGGTAAILLLKNKLDIAVFLRDRGYLGYDDEVVKRQDLYDKACRRWA